jgi:hypothetical protein
MKIAVVGSRDFFLIYDYKSGKYIVDKDKERFAHYILIDGFSGGDILISGGAKGVDIFAEKTIDEWNKIAYSYSTTPKQFKKIILLPDWDRYGKRAGFIRNQLIIDEADKVIAFWNGTSVGTKHSISLAITKKIPIDIYIR